MIGGNGGNVYTEAKPNLLQSGQRRSGRWTISIPRRYDSLKSGVKRIQIAP